MNILLTFFLLISATAYAQTGAPAKLDFALPDHSGHLSLDRGDWKVTELSAKSSGHEFGIKAEDGDLHLLAFFFLWPEKAPMSAQSCRDEMLKAEKIPADASVDRASLQSTSGVDIATALLIPKDGRFSQIRSFVAAQDECADISITMAEPVTKKAIPAQEVKEFLRTLTFSPDIKPTFRDAFAYATVEWDRHQLQGSVTAYRVALGLVNESDNPQKWRRVTTDQLSMAQGMSGDLAGSRATNEAAIKLDPDYPLYYYNLACADAEAGDATAAKDHLQKAFNRRANVLQGESFPNPEKDDSIEKLKANEPFWAFVTELSKHLKP